MSGSKTSSTSTSPLKKTEPLTGAAHRAGLSYQQLYRLVLTGEVLGFKVGSSWRVATRSLNVYLRRMKREARDG
jgi:hypothetical protein